MDDWIIAVIVRWQVQKSSNEEGVSAPEKGRSVPPTYRAETAARLHGVRGSDERQ